MADAAKVEVGQNLMFTGEAYSVLGFKNAKAFRQAIARGTMVGLPVRWRGGKMIFFRDELEAWLRNSKEPPSGVLKRGNRKKIDSAA